MEMSQFLSGSTLDQEVLKVVEENQPIKAYLIYDLLRYHVCVRSHEVAWSVWRLEDEGKVSVRAGRGVSLLCSVNV